MSSALILCLKVKAGEISFSLSIFSEFLLLLAEMSATSAPELSEATVAVAVCDGAGSRRAVHWAAGNLIPHAHRVLLVHVIPSVSFVPSPSGKRIPVVEMEKAVADLYVQDVKEKAEVVFLPYQKLCRANNVETLVLDGKSTAEALLKFLSDSRVKNLVLGSSSLRWIRWLLKGPDIPAIVLKSAPSSCNIFVISRRRLTLKFANQLVDGGTSTSIHTKTIRLKVFAEEERKHIFPYQQSSSEVHEKLLGPVDADNVSNINKKLENSIALLYGKVEESNINEKQTQIRNWEAPDASPQDGIFMPSPSQVDMKDLSPSEVVRLRLELQKSLVMYNKTCEDLVHAKKKVELLTAECSAEAKRVKDALDREAVLKKVAAEERAKHLEAIKEVEQARELLSRESLNWHKAKSVSSILSFEKSKVLDDIFTNNRRFRRYSRYEIEAATDNFSDTMKVGEGAYGYVYKCNLDHIPVAVKVVRQDASNKKEEFLREVEVLSQLNHPHMVSLLGVCPERGCLVYEYMENGSLEDQLFNIKNSQPLPWFIRFRIIFEVASGLAYLHGNKPDPIVHRDLKPANILLDKNYVSKIGDVGLAKLMSDVVPDCITEYKETILAGTLYYMDPEYQRTGTIRPKSDLYALGIIAIQLLTGKQTRGLVMQVENAIKDGTFPDILDTSISDWPVLEAKKLAKIALQCARLRCRDRPDLDSEVLPELKDLLNMANACFKLRQCHLCAPSHYLCPILQEVMDDPYIAADGYTYELRAIRAWIDRHKISPVTKLRLPHTNIIPNHSLHAAIQEWKSHASFSMLQD